MTASPFPPATRKNSKFCSSRAITRNPRRWLVRNLLGQTGQLLKPTAATSGFGTKAGTKTWPETGPEYPCRLQLAGGTENTDLKNVAIGQWKLFLPPEVPASEKDRWRMSDGRTFEIVSVYPVHRPQGLHHLEVTLETFSGGVPSG